MTYHERELLVSRSPQKRTFNNSNSRWCSSRLSPSQSLRIECIAEERHCLGHISPHTIHSSRKPVRFTMTEPVQPVQFRSQIIVHSNPETDLHIKRLRVNFHYHDDAPVSATVSHHDPIPSPSIASQSLHVPRSSSSHAEKETSSKRKFHPAMLSQPQAALYRWVDDICANEKLMANDDIVFFIKNGEFFARI